MRKLTIVIGLMAVMATPISVSAQGFPTSSGRSAQAGTIPELGNQPIALGPFLFSPALQLSWENHSNLWQSATDPVSDDIYVARMRLLFEVPIRESFIRISYTPQYRDSKNRVLHNQWDHFLEVSGDFEFSSGLVLGARYKFIEGDVATDEVDPGGELIYSGRRFKKNQFGISSNYWFSQTDGLVLNIDASKVEWSGEPVSDATSWFDYDQTNVRAGWAHQLGPTMVMDLSLGYRKYDTQEEVNALRDYTADSLTLGFRGQINDVFSTELRLGYARTDFDKSADAINGFDDFSGFVINGNVTWAMGESSKLRLDLLRQPFASNYQVNSYFTATGGRLLWDLDFGRLFAQARLRLQTNDYDILDTILHAKRSDDITIWGAGVGFRLSEKMSVRASYIHEDRDSLDPYGYLNKVWLVDLIVGY